MKKRIASRDTGIELARLLGCLIVIGVHISLSDTIDGVYDPGRGLINCFLADGVAIFWLISGCFLFRSDAYKKVLLRTVKTIAIPVAVYSVWCLFFSGWIRSGGALIQSVYHTPKEYLLGLRDALALKLPIPLTGHLWYCYTYILVMLAFPVLKAFARWMEEDRKRELWFCVISFGLLLVNDVTKNQTMAFSHHSLNAAVPAAIEILWGHILYRNKDLLLKKARLWLAAPVAFVVLNFLRMLLVLRSGSKAILYWYSTVGLICGILVVGMCMAMGSRWQKKTVPACTIQWLAGHTFMIYLVHMAVRELVYRFGLHKACQAWLGGFTRDSVLEILYTVIAIAVIFALSLSVSVVLRSITCLAKTCFTKKTCCKQ